MVRSILAQLLRKCDGIPAAVATLFSSCENGQRQPPLSAYLDVLRRIIIELPRVFPVLDALHECDSRKVLLEVIATISNWEVNSLHILLTSRMERDIQNIVEQIVRSENIVPLQSDQVDPDIRTYIVERLSKDKSLEKWHRSNEVKEEIEGVLMKNAQRMFRWAACQLDELAKCRNRAQLRKALSTLPPTLDKTYERILCAIPEEDAEYALRLLRWLAFSERPLLLKEIVEIVAFDPEREVPFDRDEIFEDPFEILDVCSSLVRTTTVSAKESNEDSDEEYSNQHNITGKAVVLSHYSVQEYLTSQRCIDARASKFALDEAVCHTLISESCLSSLLLSFSKERKENFGKLTLSDYSAQFWIIHAKKGQKTARWTQRAVTLCLDSSTLVQWVRVHDPDELLDGEGDMLTTESIPQGLYLMSLARFVEVVVQLIERYNHDVNAQGGQYGNALQAAAHAGCSEIVELLLIKGADVHARGGFYGNVLQTASHRGHEELIKLLLRKGVDVNVRGGYFDNALQAASNGGHGTIVELLIREGADINAQSEGFYDSALQAASNGGHKTIVELLIREGANVNAQSGDYGNALQAASSGGHKSIVKLLIRRGADVNAQGGEFYNSALVAASHAGYLEIVKILISKGADVNAPGGYLYVSALQAASEGGNLEIVELLISEGADVNAHDGDWCGNALQAASRGGHKKVIAKLLEHGAVHV